MKKNILFGLFVAVLILSFVILWTSKEEYYGTVILLREVDKTDEAAVRSHEITQNIITLESGENRELASALYNLMPYSIDKEFLGCYYNEKADNYSVYIMEYSQNSVNKKKEILQSKEKIYNPVIYNNYLFYRIEERSNGIIMKYDMDTGTETKLSLHISSEFGILDGKLIYNEMDNYTASIFTYDIESENIERFKEDALYSGIDVDRGKIISYTTNKIYISDIKSNDEKIITLNSNILIDQSIVNLDENVLIVSCIYNDATHDTKIYNLDNMKSKILINKKKRIYVKSMVYLR